MYSLLDGSIVTRFSVWLLQKHPSGTAFQEQNPSQSYGLHVEDHLSTKTGNLQQCEIS